MAGLEQGFWPAFLILTKEVLILFTIHLTEALMHSAGDWGDLLESLNIEHSIREAVKDIYLTVDTVRMTF